MSAYLKKFGEIPVYSDPGSKNQTCRDLMPRGIVPEMLVGYNILEGPGQTGPNSHETWHQVFVVVKGKGTLVRGQERIPVEAPCIVHIPPNTEHDVEVAPEERIEYVYINKYLTEEE